MIDVLEYLINPTHILLAATNLVLWIITYWYIRKVRKEYGSWLKALRNVIIGTTVKTNGKKTKVVVIGKTYAGKTTLVRGIGYLLTRLGYVPRNPTYITDKKTIGINRYVFTKAAGSKKLDGEKSSFMKLEKSIEIIDFAGEFKSEVSDYWSSGREDDKKESKRGGEKEKDNGKRQQEKNYNEDISTPVQFSFQQVKEIKDADVIIHVVYFYDDPLKLKRQFEEYGSAVKKALGITENSKFIRRKAHIIVVTHIDEVKDKIYNDLEIRSLISRLLPYPKGIFNSVKIIPTNPKEFIENYESNTRVDIATLEKSYHYDEIIAMFLKGLEKGGEKR